MERVRTDAVDGLTVADVTHDEFKVLPAGATVGEVRDWFAAGASRRLAVVADDGCVIGVLAMTRDRRHFACRAPAGSRLGRGAAAFLALAGGGLERRQATADAALEVDPLRAVRLHRRRLSRTCCLAG